MAPNFRQNTQTRRGNRSGYVEHDDFEGLPVREWHYASVTITPPPPPDPTRKNDIWGVELPHGMPKDSQLLPNHNQELLRASRSGQMWKRPAPAEEEEAEADPAVAEKTDKKEEDPSTKGFQIRIWKQVPRNAEGHKRSHLAKRRKGTITLSSDLPAGATPGPTITKATVRRIDAAGNPYTQEVTLNEGQPVDGVIISTTVVAAPVPNLNGDAPATPVRRRPPPPKRKPKGPGRGRKKKLPLPVSTHTNVANSAATGLASGAQVDGAQGLKPGESELKQIDIEMADDDEGDDGDDGDDGEDDGEEGDEDDEEGDGADGETSFISRANSETKSDQMDITTPQNEARETAGTAYLQPSSELPSANTKLSAPLPPPSHIEGSPLKQVVSAQSPGPLDPDSASQGSMTKLLATLDSVEQTPLPAESAPSPLPTTDGSTLPEISGANTMPTVGKDAIEDLDVEMQDGAPTFTDTSTENMPSISGDSSTAITDVQNSSLAQPIEPGGLIPPLLPVDEESRNQVTGMEPPPEIAKIGETSATPSGGEVRTPENATEADALAGFSAQDTTDPLIEPSAVQATDASSTDEQLVATPGLTEPQDEQPVPQTQEESVADSPDLFSGLEAALNQHGHSSSSEPIPEKPEAAVSQPDASFQSE
ncbi:hypothetical protein F5B21DRAFT_263955 [Xylaria acuta]|nr:hypothetical protein F5B21DRAFT_263955 [Xylaria acuta]